MNMNLFSFIKRHVSLYQLISEYSTLKKAGLYYKGCCPFHHEKTASFTVCPQKELFYCFGCAVGGDSISFIAQLERCSPYEAALYLAQKYSVQLPENLMHEQITQAHKQRKEYTRACMVFASWCAQQLMHSQAHTYIKSRMLAKKTCLDFMLGYFPSGKQALEQLLAYAHMHNILAHDLEQARIIFKSTHSSSHGFYSPFQERLIFPIKDHLGRICAFGGRIISPHDTRPKYYNSQDSQFFNKSSLLYALDSAKKAIQEHKTVYLVEGYLDALIMAQYNYPNTVATLGTACTREHLALLSRYTNTLTVLYDGDAAGKKALLRLAELCWQATLDMRVVCLPSGEDPASLLSSGQDLEPYITQSRDIFSFYIREHTQDFSSKSLQEKLQLAKNCTALIQKLQDPLKRDLLLKQAAQAFDVPFDTLINSDKVSTKREEKEIRQVKDKAQTNNKARLSAEARQSVGGKAEPSQLEKKLFSAILYTMGALSDEDKNLVTLWICQPLSNLLKKAFISCATSNSVDFEIFDESEKQLVSKYILEAEDDGVPATYEQLWTQFLKKQWKTTVRRVTLSIELAQKNGNHDRVTQLLTYLETVKKKMLQRGIV